LIDSAEEKAVTHTAMVKDQQKANVVIRLLGRGFVAMGFWSTSCLKKGQQHPQSL
jgi:hypothetical protein